MPTTTGFVQKTDFKRNATEIKKNIPSITRFFTIAVLYLKVTEIENKIPDIINLATKAALKTKVINVENKIIDTTSFISTEFNRFIKTSCDAKVKKAAKRFINKSQVDNSLDTENKHIVKINVFRSLIYLILLTKVTLAMIDHKII